MTDNKMNDKNNTAPDDVELNETASTDFGDDAVLASAAVDFARMGLNQVAYVRRAIVNDLPVWSIHAATGDTLGAAETFEQAWGAVKQNNLEPLRVH